MTKSLTEQWKSRELECGYYYIKTRSWGCDDKWHIKKEIEIDYYDEDVWSFYEDCDIYCVVAPVPVYNVWKNIHEQWKVAIPQIERLNKQLVIAKKALEDILNDGDDYWDKDKANEALTKMEGVK